MKFIRVNSLKGIVFLLLLFCFFITNTEAGLKDFDISNNQVDLNKFLSGGPGKDGIPSLTDPKFVDAKSAGFMKDDDKVVGLVRGEVAKAYPINVLNWHEIINDKIADQAVAVTWCPLTKSAVTFNREIDGKVLEFGVSGLLYNSNVVMYDRNTNSLWSQLRMGGLTGAHFSEQLEAVPAEVTTWKSWREQYPHTLVVSKWTGHWRDYRRDPYARYHKSDEVMFPLDKFDNRLPLKSLIVGIRYNGATKAYPVDVVKKDKEIKDIVGGEEIILRETSGGAINVQDKDGNILPSVVAYWFGWSTFNRDTLVFQEEG